MVDTLPFDVFWAWLTTHPNCILRAGAGDAVIYDDEPYHWHFAAEGNEMLLVQVVRGKRMVGELFIDPERVTYVQSTPGDVEGEFPFELVSETGGERYVQYYFVMTHGYEEAESPDPSRVH